MYSLIGFIGILVMFAIRNEWVFETTISVNRKIRAIINYGFSTNYYTSQEFNSMLYCLEDYDKMMLKFWIWDIEKFVVNREAYELLNNLYLKIKPVRHG